MALDTTSFPVFAQAPKLDSTEVQVRALVDMAVDGKHVAAGDLVVMGIDTAKSLVRGKRVEIPEAVPEPQPKAKADKK